MEPTEPALRDRLLEHLRSPDYQPQNKSELARALEIDSRNRAELRGIIRDLDGEGVLVRLKRGRYSLRENARNVLVGTLRSMHNGNTFFYPENGNRENRGVLAGLGLSEDSRVYIPERFAHTALNGDRVSIRVIEAAVPKWWKHVQRKRDLLKQLEEAGERPVEGRVLKILERRNARIVGTYHRNGKYAYVKPDDALLPDTIDVPGDDSIRASAGDKVLVTIDEWPARSQHPRGRILETLGPAGAPGMDILSIIHRYQLPLEFPEPVLREAERIGEAIFDDDLAGREDWRNRTVITIDRFRQTSLAAERRHAAARLLLCEHERHRTAHTHHNPHRRPFAQSHLVASVSFASTRAGPCVIHLLDA